LKFRTAAQKAASAGSKASRRIVAANARSGGESNLRSDEVESFGDLPRKKQALLRRGFKNRLTLLPRENSRMAAKQGYKIIVLRSKAQA